MFYQTSLSPQVKQSAIISNKHDMYELPNELPNDLRLGNTVKSQNFIELRPGAHLYSQNENFINTT